MPHGWTGQINIQANLSIMINAGSNNLIHTKWIHTTQLGCLLHVNYVNADKSFQTRIQSNLLY